MRSETDQPEDADEAPPRGDVVEIAGLPPEVEYERVREAGPWTLPLVIGVITLFAVFVAARVATSDDVEQLRLSTAPEGSVPSTLADGTPPPDVPEALDGRFDAPLVMTRALDEVPEDIADQCVTPFEEGRLDEAARKRVEQVVAAGRLVDLRVGPDAVNLLRVGPADSPPAWPDEWALSCIGRPDGEGGWAARPPRLAFVRDGDRGASDAGPGVVARIVRAPSGAAWFAQERDGWWLAGPVEGGGWVQLSVPLGAGDLPMRVAFLDADGEPVADRRIVRPPSPGSTEEPDAPAAQGTIDVGPVAEVLDTVDDAPVRACDEAVCVWITRVGSELVAHAAHGPHPLDVPPFGELGWCPGADGFQGTVTRSTFDADGSHRSGVAPRGADAFAVRFAAGRVLVDLSARTPGDVAESGGDVGVLCSFTDEPTGQVPPDDVTLEQL